ncbi:MAG: YihY/virulence factor BrkB family protein [Clostridiaceae bacterium]
MEATKNKKKYPPIIEFIVDLVNKLNKDDAIPYAYQLSYSLLLAIFPFLIFVLTLVGFMNLDSDRVITEIQLVMPGEAFALFEGIIKEVTQKQNGTLLSISILTAIWAASGGFKAFIRAMNNVHGLKEDRSFIKVNLDAILMVIFLAVGIAGSLLFMVFAQPIIDLIRDFIPNFTMDSAMNPFGYLIPLGFIFVLFLVFYMFVPARNVKFKYALPGAVFSALAFMLVSIGFQIYVTNFANYSRFYGAMGAVMILIFWLLLISIIMIVGGEINALLIIRKGVHSPFMKSSRDSTNVIKQEAVQIVQEKYKKTPKGPHRI